jgi:hypothetical protein
MSKLLMANQDTWTGAPATGFSQPATQSQRSLHVTGLSKAQAEDLLDWLEANGYRDYHLSYDAGEGFTVSYSNDQEANTQPVLTPFRSWTTT